MGNSIDARKGRIAASPRATAASCSKLMGEHFCGGRSGAYPTAGKTGHDQPDADMREKYPVTHRFAWHHDRPAREARHFAR